MATMPHELFRVIRMKAPRRSDFWSDLANGLPPRLPQRVDVTTWAGVSMYADFSDAEKSARTFALGRSIARVEIPDGAPVLVKQTLKLGHFSVVGDPTVLMGYVIRVMRIA